MNEGKVWPFWQLPTDSVRDGHATLPDGTKAKVLQETKLNGSCAGTVFVIVTAVTDQASLEDVLSAWTSDGRVG